MTIQEYFGDWCKVIDTIEADGILKKLVSSKEVICPKVKDVFKAFTLCNLQNLRVVILGQDPYPQKDKATGIAFANSSDTLQCNYSPSLDVLMESVIDFTCPHDNIIFDPSLEKWEKQGVLLLNTALSCILGKVGSHSLMWRPFIKSFLTNLSCYDTGIIYVLMGSEAQSFLPYINSKYNHIIKTKHPSWYARNHLPMPSDLWYQINDILTGMYGYGIEWYKDNNYINRQENSTENEEVLYEEY